MKKLQKKRGSVAPSLASLFSRLSAWEGELSFCYVINKRSLSLLCGFSLIMYNCVESIFSSKEEVFEGLLYHF